MPPKGWKKPVPEPQTGPVSQDVAETIIANADEPEPVPGARKSGLSANLDTLTQERIAAVNEVTVMCKGGLGRFDFKALWLKQLPDAIPVGELTPRLKSAVLAADEIWINCKMKRENDPDVTLNHSRHNALWLKEYV